MAKKKEVKEISYDEYVKETNKYYTKAFRDYAIILLVVILTFILG